MATSVHNVSHVRIFAENRVFYFLYVRNYHYLAEFLNRKYKILEIW
jgi:hypothetical protein